MVDYRKVTIEKSRLKPLNESSANFNLHKIFVKQLIKIQSSSEDLAKFLNR